MWRIFYSNLVNVEILIDVLWMGEYIEHTFKFCIIGRFFIQSSNELINRNLFVQYEMVIGWIQIGWTDRWLV